MRLTIVVLGHTLDLSLEPTAAEDEADPLRDLGATGSTFLSFTSAHVVPEEVPFPQRTPAWDDEE